MTCVKLILVPSRELFEFHLKSQLHEILAECVIWANLKHDKA